MGATTGQRRRVVKKDAPTRPVDQFDHVEYMSQHGHEEVATWIDRETGLRAMMALHEEALGRSSLAGVRVAVQGLGHVGMSLAEQLLRDEGAVVIAADVRSGVVEEARERFAGESRFSLVSADEIHMQECDVFAPC